MSDTTFERDRTVMERLRQAAPDLSIDLLAMPDPEDVAGVIAGVMLMLDHKHALDIEPETYLGLVGDGVREHALSSAAVLVAALERKGYRIARVIE